MIKTITDEQVIIKWTGLRDSAKSRGLEFNLGFTSVKNLLKAKKCHYTGAEFGKGLRTLSVDRVDPNKGYVVGNVVACTVGFNQLKSNVEHLGKDKVLRAGKALLKIAERM